VFPKIVELSRNITVHGLGDVAVSIVNVSCSASMSAISTPQTTGASKCSLSVLLHG
jgi:hypothetical protein